MPTVTGRLWHSDSSIAGFKSGTYLSAINGGAPLFVTDYRFSAVDRTGDRFVRDDYDASSGAENTTIQIISTQSGAALANFKVDGYATELKLSPTNSNWLLGTWATDFIATRHTIVYDMAADRLLFVTPDADAGDAFDWLPDGRLVRVRTNGTVSTMSVGGQETGTGTAAWPQGWTLAGIVASPDGKSLAVRMNATTSRDRDLWVMAVDGWNLQRFTVTNITSYTVWSPDSKYLAFNKDTGFACSDSACQGSCRIWYAPSTARGIAALDASNDASTFDIKTSSGGATRLGCQLLAWTP